MCMMCMRTCIIDSSAYISPFGAAAGAAAAARAGGGLSERSPRLELFIRYHFWRHLLLSSLLVFIRDAGFW